MIRELVGIDRVARERVETIKAWRDEQKKSIAEEKTKLSEDFAAERERLLAKFTEETQAERDAKIAELESESATLIAALERKFDSNRSEWTDALLKRVTEC
jgi:hypothetical protein